MINYYPDDDNWETDRVSLNELEIECPWCWQTICLQLDCSAGNQSYSEDCEVCCRPMLLQLTLEHSGKPVLAVSRESD
jgi:hypothetical protein